MVIDLWYRVNREDEKVETMLIDTSLKLTEDEINELIVKPIHRKYKACTVGYSRFSSMSEYEEFINNLGF